MIHQGVARALLAALCVLQALATVAIDLNAHHAQNSSWTGHARFHVVWQTTAFAALATVELVLLSAPGPLAEQRFYLAAALTGIPMLAFFVAFTGRQLYGGLLADPDNLPPLPVRIFAGNWHIDLNLAAEIAGLLSLVAIILIFRQPGARH